MNPRLRYWEKGKCTSRETRNKQALDDGLLLRSTNNLSQSFLVELFEGFGRTLFRLVLDGGSVGLDNVHRGEGFSVEGVHDEFTLLVTTEAIHINVSIFLGKVFKGVFHFLAELAPRSVDGDNGGLSGRFDLQRFVGG